MSYIVLTLLDFVYAQLGFYIEAISKIEKWLEVKDGARI